MYENVGIECLSPESSNHSLPKRNGFGNRNNTSIVMKTTKENDKNDNINSI